MGTQIPGVAILRNETNASIPWYACPHGSLSVGLARPGIPFNPPAIALDFCISKRVLKPRSTTRIPISIWTNYESCGGLQEAVPVCPHNGIPLLPLGEYSVVVLKAGLPPHTTVLATSKVTLVNASTGRSTGPVGGSIAIQSYGCGTLAYQPPLSIVVIKGTHIVARRGRLGVTQQMTVGVSPGTYIVRSGAHPNVVVHVVNGVQASAVVIPRCD